MTTRKFKGKSSLVKKKNELWNVLRDYIFEKYDNTCFTCGARNLEGSNRHLGHFQVGATCPQDLYFDVDNLRCQCFRCNVFLSGHPHVYRYNLIKEIGKAKVEALDKRVREGKPVKWYEADFDKRIAEVKELHRAI